MQGVPAAGPIIALLHQEMDPAGVSVLQQPPAIGLPLGSEQINSFVEPPIRGISGDPEVLQAAHTS